ncbi:hypothetical protein Y032_0015g2879 [Ancylostoma ceylanicum]|nr:hypothetical protein Y032_0015g2879 [Ancylostoma ceylanicum]
MAQYYAILTLASILALSGCLQLRPDCSQLGQYAMPSDEHRMVLFSGVEHLAPRKDVGLKVVSFVKQNKQERLFFGLAELRTYFLKVYECALEGMAGLILQNPGKPLTCPQSLGIYPLIFET